MQLFVLIIKQVYQMNDLIRELAKSGVKGGTVLEGTGMAETLMNMEDLPLFGMLKRALVEEGNGTSKVMLFVLKDDQVKTTSEIIKKIIGDLNMPNTGIMFSIPISYVEGLGR